MIKHLDHLNLTVADLEATTGWYGGLFDFEVVEAGTWRGRPWRILRSGDALLCLYEHPELAPPGAAPHHRLNHFALRIHDAEAFQARAAALGVPIQYDGAVEWPHSTSFYVEDPTGHEIEVVAWHGDRVAFGA